MTSGQPGLLEQFDVATPPPLVLDRRYIGGRRPAPVGHRGATVVEVQDGNERRPLAMLGRHSPDGFEWGYFGSGCAELALAILTDHLGYEPPPAVYQRYKAEVIALLPLPGWTIAAGDVATWLGRHLGTWS